MGQWLISITAVVALSVLLDIIVPEGEINKYIKGIFALITIFVIISPIASLINSNYSFEDTLNNNNNTFQIDNSFVDYTKDDINNITNNALEKHLKDKGYNNTVVRIYLDYDNKINFVTVDINNLIIDEKLSHINITNDIVSIVQEVLNINKERIIVYGSYTG